MFLLLGIIVVIFMYYQSAKDANKSKALWVTFGVGTYFLLGLFFLLITERYILHIQSVTDGFTLEKAQTKDTLGSVSAVIIVAISYGIKKVVLVKDSDRDKI
jgi:hypothetical protein